MHLVVDTNVLFSYFKKDSASSKLIKNNSFVFYCPDYSKIELKKYKELIKTKYSLTETEFIDLLLELTEYITFYSQEDYKICLKQFINFKDQKDIDFLALALYLNLPLWSNDKLLTTQSKVRILSTRDIFDLIDIID